MHQPLLLEPLKEYRFPSGFHKSQVLFNLNRARQDRGRNVIIVEGFFDAVKVYQAGHPNVVALMGSSLSDEQERLLQKHFDHAVLMLDGDEAGQRATATISNRLSGKMDVFVRHHASARTTAGPTGFKRNEPTAWCLRQRIPRIREMKLGSGSGDNQGLLKQRIN